MSNIRGQVDIDTWFVEDLIAASTKDIKSNREITIPPFQRGLVWNKKKQEDLIDSIKRGYPIGTLLLYEVMTKGNGGPEAKRFYNLIDGLQRTNALKQYTSHPNRFFNKDDVDDSFIDFLARELELQSEQAKDSIRRVVSKWVMEVPGFRLVDGFDPNELTKTLISGVLKIPRETEEFVLQAGKFSLDGRFQKRVAQFLDSVRDRSDINKVKIPIMIFTGEASELPTVFALLNTRSTVLSRYEVFAATWVEEKARIDNKSIRDAIWNKYSALEEASFNYDAGEEAPDEKTRVDYEYTLFEYLFGFGQYLSDKFPRLFAETADDRPSSAGFNLMCASVGLQINNMDSLPEALRNKERNRLEQCIIESIQFVEKTLDPILSVNQQKKNKTSIYHTEYQITSMIAAALKVRYDEGNLSEIDGWRASRKKLGKHLTMYYLYDILREHWRGSGDSKLHDAVSNERYLNPLPSEDSWKNVIDTWFTDNQITLVHKGRYIRDQNPEILLLKYIYAGKFNLIQGAKSYHVEHIIPVARLQSLLERDEDKLTINTISNLALLGPSENIRKGDLTYVEYLDKQRVEKPLSESEFNRQLESFEKQLICESKILPTNLTKSSYDDFVTARFDLLKKEFLQVWRDHIPADPQT